jgi:hypothetical protein
MPMPPPKPTTEGPRDRHVTQEIGQIVRALRSRGPLEQHRLSEVVGAEFWETGRWDRALALALADGRVTRTAEGHLAASGV